MSVLDTLTDPDALGSITDKGSELIDVIERDIDSNEKLHEYYLLLDKEGLLLKSFFLERILELSSMLESRVAFCISLMQAEERGNQAMILRRVNKNADIPDVIKTQLNTKFYSVLQEI